MWKCTCYTLKKKLYLWLIHVDVWQKLTQYCKAIILQLKTLKSQIIIYIMSNLCTYIIFTYTCIWIENSLEKCVLKYQERWFLSGETEIISALFFIPFSTFDFSKTNKLDFFLTFWTQVFPKISEYESWKWLLGSLSLTVSVVAISHGLSSSYLQPSYDDKQSPLSLHTSSWILYISKYLFHFDSADYKARPSSNF